MLTYCTLGFSNTSFSSRTESPVHYAVILSKVCIERSCEGLEGDKEGEDKTLDENEYLHTLLPW